MAGTFWHMCLLTTERQVSSTRPGALQVLNNRMPLEFFHSNGCEKYLSTGTRKNPIYIYKGREKINLKKKRRTSMVQSVEHQTSSHVMTSRSVSSSPTWGLLLLVQHSLQFFCPPPLSLPLLHLQSLSKK